MCPDHRYVTVNSTNPLATKSEGCFRCGIVRETLLPDLIIRGGAIIEELPRRRYRFMSC